MKISANRSTASCAAALPSALNQIYAVQMRARLLHSTYRTLPPLYPYVQGDTALHAAMTEQQLSQRSAQQHYNYH
eukprot:12091-Heterococcus_DN1.PRE.2